MFQVAFGSVVIGFFISTTFSVCLKVDGFVKTKGNLLLRRFYKKC